MNALIHWNPLLELQNVQDRILRAMNPTGPRPGAESRNGNAAAWVPVADIAEETGEYLIQLDLPGIAREDVKVTVDDGHLFIEGERRTAEVAEGRKFHRTERVGGRFRRGFLLPEDAEADRVTAEFKDGVLLVRLPKAEAKQPRRIEVTVN